MCNRPGRKRKFPVIFFLISAACFLFLWVNIHAPLSLKTFSNLDHHFIRHDGFVVNEKIELGRSDTVNFSNNAYNSFVLSKKDKQVRIVSVYSEDPFYIRDGGNYKIVSKTYPASGHSLAWKIDLAPVELKAINESEFELSVNGQSFSIPKEVKKGISAWNIFKETDSFINSIYFNNEKLIASLKHLFIVRDNVSAKGGQELKFFISGRLFQYAGNVVYEGKPVTIKDAEFNTAVLPGSNFAWGIGFMDNNKNQFRLKEGGNDSFFVFSRYPVSYPLTEENTENWSQHSVNKFLVSDSKDLLGMPAVFREGFLFSAFEQDGMVDFDPVLLTYQRNAENKDIQLNARWFNKSSPSIDIKNNTLLLPARSKGFNWLFSVRNTFNWEFGSSTLSASVWQALLFGSLFFFFILIFFTSLVISADKLSWVWQLLSCVTIVLLTTRFFLYWRYKSFPPYEGMDLPSQQQLQSFWNFGIIIFTTIILAILFGFGFVKYAGLFIRRSFSRISGRIYRPRIVRDGVWEKMKDHLIRLSIIKRYGSKTIFFISWLLILIAGGGLAYISHFDPGTCRHLAIGLTVAYFVYVFISYRYSPLVISSQKSWWRINTGRTLDMVISNPVKVLLSISLLGTFVFTDIGFAIVFLNFLLFNEAFLCINYAIAGLSAGSRKNAGLFGIAGAGYLLLFIGNLLYAPYIFSTLLDLPQSLYLAGYVFFAVVIAYHLLRLFADLLPRKKILVGSAITCLFFIVAFFFFPKEKIVEKAAMTKYRIDVLTMPVDKAIELAYTEGKTYEPVIRAAQNQWFINTLIYEKNNPGVQSPGFHLLPHAPQNKGAKYNAQATDLVASRFFLAEHGKWSVLLYVLLLLLPSVLLASFYKLYPDFTNRVNERYPTITAGFSILNYLLITALLVILAATGRYIFFGQDMPFGSILSKQSILFPSILIIAAVLLFRNIPLEYYANRKKLIPGLIVFSILAVLLFFIKPAFNKNKEFNVSDLAKEMDDFVQLRLQPVMDHFDTSAATKKYSISGKDQLFTDSVRKLVASGVLAEENRFFAKEIELYSRLDFSRHLDQSRMLYLDLYSGRPQLSVNDNYFRVEPPPHLQQSWTGNVSGDSLTWDISLSDHTNGTLINKRLNNYTNEPETILDRELALSFRSPKHGNQYEYLYLLNTGNADLHVKNNNREVIIRPNDSIRLANPCRLLITGNDGKTEKQLVAEPDAFMKNYYVNGNRFYVYPMGNRFTWARNFAESIASDYTAAGQSSKNAVVSFDYTLMDSLSAKIRAMMNSDTAYKKGAEYGICIADGNGRLIAMADFIKGFARPDPNDKAGFTKTIMGEKGFISPSLLRKQIGNINLLRLNPGPGSTLKPIVFSAIASQLNLDWDAFAAEGFSEPQHYFGGEKVAEYDFEKNNGRIANVVDYLKYSDNYYHSDLLLLGSYPKQGIDKLLSASFARKKPDEGVRWPSFHYNGSSYWLDGFENWPGYLDGKANFGSDSSFTSIGLVSNYGIYTQAADKSFDMFYSAYDSSLFLNAYKKSGFLLPEYPLFDQQGSTIDRRIPYDVFTSCFRGHVKGSSQVMISPAKMVEAFGKMISQSRNYSLTLNPYAAGSVYSPFVVDNTIVYNNYLSLVREGVFEGLKQVLHTGTAARLGSLLPKNSPYFYYAKTGTTGDNEAKTKSKLLAIVISEKDITDPGFNFRNNKFYTIYFTLQNGPAKQNEEFQAEIIRCIEQSGIFARYMTK
ncbi:MAG: hypothetical protein WDO16_14970 [Bacteroidota bacterium]